MVRTPLALCLCALVLAAFAARPAHADDDGETITMKWKDGLKFESKDKQFAVHVGGLIQSDWTTFIGPSRPDLAPLSYRAGHAFRRARLMIDGTLYKHVRFIGEYDFAGGNVGFRDVYVETTGLSECWGCLFPDIRIGHYKEIWSLEWTTSDKWTTFLERSLPVLAFTPGYNTGIQLSKALYGDRINLSFGVLGQNTNDAGNFSWDDGYDVTGRVTWTPWAPCDCDCRVLHLGASAIYTDYSRGFAPTFAARPETGIGDNIATTGAIANADTAFRYAGEMAFVYDRFSLQGEYLGCSVERTVGADPTFSGYYAQASWMLTGPCRNYKKAGAKFDRVKPCRNFGCDAWGAWELAARYSYLDLTDAGIAGGEVWDVTVGLNWYLNPNTRVMLNYVHSELENRAGVVNGSVDAVGVRVQVDF